MSLASAGSLVGGALILAAFLALQLRRVDPEDRRYLALNTVGAVVLVASALLAELWGFVILNVVWAGASAIGLARRRGANPARQESPSPLSDGPSGGSGASAADTTRS